MVEVVDHNGGRSSEYWLISYFLFRFSLYVHTHIHILSNPSIINQPSYPLLHAQPNKILIPQTPSRSTSTLITPRSPPHPKPNRNLNSPQRVQTAPNPNHPPILVPFTSFDVPMIFEREREGGLVRCGVRGEARVSDER